jgi:tetratricopeptide (TPR) repeat protein/predicted Ser/Thr protein kinase
MHRDDQDRREPPPRPTRPPDLLPRGTTLDRYVVLDVIGRGAVGVVYSAYDTQLNRKLAIKVLRPDLARVSDVVEMESRLLREAQAMARLTHPNVVAVHDVGTYKHRVFLAMEFVEGVTLKEWLGTERPLRERLAALRDAGRGLVAAHASGLVHRDFKPDNVLVGNDGRVVVVDFGLARAQGDATAEASVPSIPSVPSAPALPSIPSLPSLREEDVAGGANDPLHSPLTLSGTVLGTVGYMAPEQAFGEAANQATDQFSYAATLYVALYGEKPFPSKTIAGYLREVEAPVPEPHDAKGVPTWLRRIVLRGLSPKPQDRFPSMEAMLAALEKDPTVGRRRATLAAGALVVIAVALFAVTRELRQRELVCAPNPAELRNVWDPSTREAMTQAFLRSGGPAAQPSADRVAKRLDVFAQQWTEMRESACRATRIDKQQSEEVYRLRDDCLNRERTQARSLTAMLVDADPQVVSKSIDITYGLPETSWCADVATLRASSGLPDDPAKRQKVLDVREKLAEAATLHVAGRYREGKGVAEAAVSLARNADHAQTTAEALLAEGGMEAGLGEHVASVSRLREAFGLALGSGADSIAVQAATQLAFATGTVLQHSEESAIWLDAARAVLTRMGGNEELELEILRVEADAFDEVYWSPERALPIQEKIVTADRRIYGAHPKTADALYNVGVSLSYLGEHARARPYFEEASAMDLAIGGPSYSEIGGNEYMLGQTLVWVGEPDQAGAHLRRAIEIFEPNGMDYWLALTYQTLTSLELVRGDARAALAYGRQAATYLAKIGSPSDLVPYVDVPLGDALVRSGSPGEALALCERARTEEEKSAGGLDPKKVYAWDALRCEGAALTALGRSEEAMPYLERSLTLQRRMFPGDYARAEFALARALGALHRDRPRAMQLADAAHAELARSPFLAWELKEVDAWLAATAR